MHHGPLRTLLATLALLVLPSCSDLPEKRTLLSSAGFLTIPATTPAQQARLRGLKPGKVVLVKGTGGEVRYVFPDPSKGFLMVGTPLQFQRYKTLKMQQQQIDEKLLDAQVNMDNADWSAFNNEAGWGFGIASDP